MKKKNTPEDMSQERNTVVQETPVEDKKNFLERLKAKWGVNSLFQVVLILIVFAATGSTVVAIRKAFFGWLGFDQDTATWLKTVTYIGFMMPAYQILLLAYGTLFGQFRFFWEKEKKMVQRIGSLFKSKK